MVIYSYEHCLLVRRKPERTDKWIQKTAAFRGQTMCVQSNGVKRSFYSGEQKHEHENLEKGEHTTTYTNGSR